jgi:hypothetical protein
MPEFAFEHQIDLVHHAIWDRGITYPVVADLEAYSFTFG